MRINGRNHLAWGMSAALSFSLLAATVGNASDESHGKGRGESETQTPIKHVIVLIGENRGADHTFGVYKPIGKQQTISNLLSKGIVNLNGSPGPHFALAKQFSVAPQASYYIGAPGKAKTAYGDNGQMPQPNTAGAPHAQSTSSPPFTAAFL